MSRKSAAEQLADGPVIEVDPHHSAFKEGDKVEPGDPELEGAPPPEATGVVALAWTPEEAGAFVCSIFNIGMIVWGPDWAATPAETAGWNTYCAQLLDQVLPRGMGGAVELGVGLIMIGNGLAMMTLRRWPLIQAGPKPMWGSKPKEAAPVQEVSFGGTVAPPPDNAGGSYRLPRDLVVAVEEQIPGTGL